MPITYFEHYPHYMGTRNAEVKFTNKEFEKLVTLSKALIKENKSEGGAEDKAYDAFEEFKTAMEKKSGDTMFALDNAMLESPRRPSTIANAINKKGVWSDQWEEGSFAFATTATKARKAVGKIEAKMAEDEFDY